MKLSNIHLQYINALHLTTGVIVRDCLIDNEENIFFLASEKDFPIIIANKGEKLRQLQKKLNKKIEVYCFKKTPESFLINAFKNIKFKEVKANKEEITTKVDIENKKKFLENQNKLKKIKFILDKKYGIKSLKVKEEY
ncbi:MAG: hypothetical protein ABH821_05270 [archaeon]